MISRLSLSKKQWVEMHTHVARQIPLEACGLLAGKNDQVEKVLLVRNQAQSPVRFVMDPYEQLEAFNWIESHDQGASHRPDAPAKAGPTKIKGTVGRCLAAAVVSRRRRG